MLPQHVLEEGGYHVKGKKESEHADLVADAEALQEAGAFAIVLELVAKPVAKVITRRLSIPTIGIGAGPDCDENWSRRICSACCRVRPEAHLKPKLNAAEQIQAVVKAWRDGVAAGSG